VEGNQAIHRGFFQVVFQEESQCGGLYNRYRNSTKRFVCTKRSSQNFTKSICPRMQIRRHNTSELTYIRNKRSGTLVWLPLWNLTGYLTRTQTRHLTWKSSRMDSPLAGSNSCVPTRTPPKDPPPFPACDTSGIERAVWRHFRKTQRFPVSMFEQRSKWQFQEGCAPQTRYAG
jgi:hypothetical protein